MEKIDAARRAEGIIQLGAETAELIKISAKSSYSQTIRGEDESCHLASGAPHHSLSMSHYQHLDNTALSQSLSRGVAPANNFMSSGGNSNNSITMQGKNSQNQPRGLRNQRHIFHQPGKSSVIITSANRVSENGSCMLIGPVTTTAANANNLNLVCADDSKHHTSSNSVNYRRAVAGNACTGASRGNLQGSSSQKVIKRASQ